MRPLPAWAASMATSSRTSRWIRSPAKLYVSIGSTCNVCVSDTQSNPVRASIYVYNPDGSGGRLFARGLRNAEGLALGTRRAASSGSVVNNRDDVPYPFNDASGNYGKCLCRLRRRPPTGAVHQREGRRQLRVAVLQFQSGLRPAASTSCRWIGTYDTNRNGAVNCGTMTRATKGIPAHSAPLGLTFMQSHQVPDLLSHAGPWWHCTAPGTAPPSRAGRSSYFPWDPSAQRPGPQYDFVSGWLNGNSYWGRPVDTAVDSSGALLISDDLSGDDLSPVADRDDSLIAD